jgi:ribose transport system substrate-binding protein
MSSWKLLRSRRYPLSRWHYAVLAVVAAAFAAISVSAAASVPNAATVHHTTIVPNAATVHHTAILPKSKIKIALVPGGPNAWFNDWGKAAKVVSKALGVTVTYVVPPTPTFQASIETATINSLVAKGYNAFGIFPDGSSSMKPVYERLAARGIPVIDLEGCTDAPTPAALCYANPVRQSAKYETEVLIKAMGGEGKIAFLTSQLTNPDTLHRVDGAKQAVAETHGKVQLVQVLGDIDTPALAPPAVESLLASKGTELKGMDSSAYYPSVAAANIMTSNSQFRHVVFIGQDNDPVVMKAIAKHYIYGTMIQNAYGQAIVGATWLYNMLAKGCTVKPGAPFTNESGTNHFLSSGFLLVDQHNIKTYFGKGNTVPANTKQTLAQTGKFLSCP